jgi:hypothetical protein
MGQADMMYTCEHCAQFRVALADLVDRWSTERGYDGAIQRARKLLLDHALRCADAEAVTAALRTTDEP